MSEVIGDRVRVFMPFVTAYLVPQAKLSLDRIPDLELRAKHVETGEIRSEPLKITQKLSPAEGKAVELAAATEVLTDWLTKRYKDTYVPVGYKSWEQVVKWHLLPFIFSDRMKHLRPPKSFQSMLEAGHGHDAPQLKLHLNTTKNFYVNSTYYRIPETERQGKGPAFVFESSYDLDIKNNGAIAGFADVFGTRQVICMRHRFVNLQANFEHEELCRWAEDRINTLLPGIVTKGLIGNFQWLEKGRFFGGDDCWPFVAADARASENQHKEEA